MSIGSDSLSVIIGLSPRVDGLRRNLRRRGFGNVGVATCVAGLRRELVSGGHRLVLSCMLLDEPTLCAHGEDLRRLQADAKGFDADWRSIGLVADPALMARAAALGCHCYLAEERRVASMLDRLVAHWWRGRTRHPGSMSIGPQAVWSRIAPAGGRFAEGSGFPGRW